MDNDNTDLFTRRELTKHLALGKSHTYVCAILLVHESRNLIKHSRPMRNRRNLPDFETQDDIRAEDKTRLLDATQNPRSRFYSAMWQPTSASSFPPDSSACWSSSPMSASRPPLSNTTLNDPSSNYRCQRNPHHVTPIFAHLGYLRLKRSRESH